MRSTHGSGPTFELLKYLCDCICFHYQHLDAHLHTYHRLRASSIYIDYGKKKDIHKYDVIRYPWLSTNYTPYATGISLHVMLMDEIEAFKAEYEKKNTYFRGYENGTRCLKCWWGFI